LYEAAGTARKARINRETLVAAGFSQLCALVFFLAPLPPELARPLGFLMLGVPWLAAYRLQFIAWPQMAGLAIHQSGMTVTIAFGDQKMIRPQKAFTFCRPLLRPLRAARRGRTSRRLRATRSGCSPGRPGRSTDDDPLPSGRLHDYELVVPPAGVGR
jgi:hypothetical protein